MRWFLIPAVATTALALANPTPAEAQIVIGRYQISPPAVRVTPYPVVSTPVSPRVLPNFNDGLVNVAVDNWLRSVGPMGYGPYAGYYAPFAGPRYYGFANPANYVPGRVFQPLNVPATNWKPVGPRSGNPGLHRGWFKGKGR